MSKAKQLVKTPPGSRRELLNEILKAALTKIVVLGSTLSHLAQLVNAPVLVTKTVLDMVLITIFGKDSFVLAFDYVPKYTKLLCQSLMSRIDQTLPKNQLIREINDLYRNIDLDIEKKKNLVKLTYIVLLALVTAFIVGSIIGLLKKKRTTYQSFFSILLKELKEQKVKSSIKYIIIPCLIIASIIFMHLIQKNIQFKQTLQKELLQLKHEIMHSSHIQVALKKKDYKKVIEEISEILNKQKM